MQVAIASGRARGCSFDYRIDQGGGREGGQEGSEEGSQQRDKKGEQGDEEEEGKDQESC